VPGTHKANAITKRASGPEINVGLRRLGKPQDVFPRSPGPLFASKRRRIRLEPDQFVTFAPAILTQRQPGSQDVI
jgi:hypothetical protein